MKLPGVFFVLQADDVHALLQDAMPPVVQPPSLTKSSINLGNSSDASSNNSVTFNASDLGVAAGASGTSAGASMSITAEGCNMERTMAEGERGIDSMSVSAFLNSVGLEQLVCVFEKEQISMDILVEMGHDELKEVGINAYGHRHKILKGIEKLAASKGQILVDYYFHKNLKANKVYVAPHLEIYTCNMYLLSK